MKVKLDISQFENDRLVVSYGSDRQALFTIVDEEYQGQSSAASVNKINILTRTVSGDGTVSDAKLQSGIIGLGNGTVGVITDDPSLLGKVLTKDNMSRVTVWLYEDGE